MSKPSPIVLPCVATAEIELQENQTIKQALGLPESFPLNRLRIIFKGKKNGKEIVQVCL